MRREIGPTLLVIGLVIALLGIGIDYLLPGAAPGVNLLLLFIVAAGLALSLMAARLRRGKILRGNQGGLARMLAAVAIVTLVTLLVLEIVFLTWGMATYFPPDPAVYELSESPWWVCGDAGCHYDYAAVQTACESGELRGRVCKINRQGYADSEDFYLLADWEDRTRVLLLGDSFTWGASADIGSSFAEILEAALPQVIVWNTGIPGTGANQALLTFDVYAPVLQPQLTILGFVQNDFDDNLLPVDSWVNALDANGQAIHVRKYAIDEEENVTEFDLYTLGYIRAHGKAPPSSELERRLGSIRLGTILLQLRDMVASPAPDAIRYERRRQVTKQYLLELKHAVSSSGSELLVVLIPDSEDIEDVQGLRPRFQIAKELLRELEIPYLNPISLLDPVADYGLPLDRHWTNAGHQKVGKLLSDCVRRFFLSGEFRECDLVALP